MDHDENVFADLEPAAWPYKFSGTLHLGAIAGGTPSDPRIVESWLKSRLVPAPDAAELQQTTAMIMKERNIDLDTAIAEIARVRHTNGFKRDSELGMYVEGRHLKAALKEAVSVTVASPEAKLNVRFWGTTRKFLTTYFPEHVFITEDVLYLRSATTGQPFHEPTEIRQSFPVNARIHQTGIQYTEIIRDALLDFTVLTDHPFTRLEWGMIWNTGMYQGLGAQRSQEIGRYKVIRWEQVRGDALPATGSSSAPAKKDGDG
jgi:hypothetical protein